MMGGLWWALTFLLYPALAFGGCVAGFVWYYLKRWGRLNR